MTGRPEILTKLSSRIEPENPISDLGIVPESYEEFVEIKEELLSEWSLADPCDLESFRHREILRFPSGKLDFADRRILAEADSESERVSHLAYFPLLKNWLAKFELDNKQQRNALQILALPEWTDRLYALFQEETKFEFEDSSPISPERVFEIYDTLNKEIRVQQKLWIEFFYNFVRFRKSFKVKSMTFADFEKPFILANDFKWITPVPDLQIDAFLDNSLPMGQRVHSFETKLDAHKQDLSQNNQQFMFGQQPVMFSPDKIILVKSLIVDIMYQGNLAFLNKLLFSNSLLEEHSEQKTTSFDSLIERQFEFENKKYCFSHTLRETLLNKNLNRFLLKEFYAKVFSIEFTMVILHIMKTNPDKCKSSDRTFLICDSPIYINPIKVQHDSTIRIIYIIHMYIWRLLIHICILFDLYNIHIQHLDNVVKY